MPLILFLNQILFIGYRDLQTTKERVSIIQNAYLKKLNCILSDLKKREGS